MGAKKLKNKSITTLFLTLILISGYVSAAAAQSSILSLENLNVELRLVPSHVAGEGTYSIGYVNLVNKNGILVKPNEVVTIELKSENPSIAAVPPDVTITANNNYAMFEVHVEDSKGETTISASINGQTVFQNFIVGDIINEIPNDVELVIHIPSNEMHVESEMPFSIFIQTIAGKTILAPYDIEVNLDFEESLMRVSAERLVIEKGTYYAWGIITTNEEVGTAFIRATQNEFNIHSAKNIKISSSLPTGLKVNVFPKIVASELDRNIDVIVSLVDSEGLPTLAQEDVKLEFFSDNAYVGEKIDDTMDESASNGIIKKGDFSYHFRQKLSLNNVSPEIIIGASTEGLGIAFDCFMTRQAFTSDNPIAGNKTMHVFTLDSIPSNTNTVGIYQIGTLLEIEESTETDDGENDCVDLEMFDKDSSDTDRSVEFHPVISNENLVSEGNYQKINLISSDSLLLSIQKVGNIDSGYSYGTAEIHSGKEAGTATLSATIKGMGSATSPTEIVNTLKHDKTMIFSPGGSESILFDKDGNFDLFIISLDGKERPTFVENEAKYLLYPVNELVEIEKNRTFAHAKFHSNSFGAVNDDVVLIEALPVGVSADDDLKALASFEKISSSIVKVTLPFNEMDTNSDLPYNGIIQLVDFTGNPIQVSSDLKVKLNSTNSELVKIPRFITISEGTTYGIFEIFTNGRIGKAEISANANGVLGSMDGFFVKSFLTKLKISTGSIKEPIQPGEPIELKLYIDDQNLESVEGATIKITSDSNTIITPANIKTEKDGSARIFFTASPEFPSISLDVFASAEGYVDEQKTFQISVNTDADSLDSLVLGFPEWIVYLAVAAILVIGAIMFIFLKKPKQVEDDEYEEIYENEDI